MKNNNLKKDLLELRKNLREAVANYIASEGCSCCRDSERHDESKKKIAKLLNVPKYSDNSGYDFSKYQTIYKKSK